MSRTSPQGCTEFLPKPPLSQTTPTLQFLILISTWQTALARQEYAGAFRKALVDSEVNASSAIQRPRALGHHLVAQRVAPVTGKALRHLIPDPLRMLRLLWGSAGCIGRPAVATVASIVRSSIRKARLQLQAQRPPPVIRRSVMLTITPISSPSRASR